MPINSITDTKIQPVISPTKRGPYRQHSEEFKRAVVAKSFVPGSSVARVARESGINANQLSGDGLCLLAKRLEKGRFVWPQASSGSVALSHAQLSMLLEGIDWRRPARTCSPTSDL